MIATIVLYLQLQRYAPPAASAIPTYMYSAPAEYLQVGIASPLQRPYLCTITYCNTYSWKMKEKDVSLAAQTPRQVIDNRMNKTSKYTEVDKMYDLIAADYSMLLVMHRFGIALGIGEKTIKEVCKQNNVHCPTFLTVVNFLLDDSLLQPDAGRNIAIAPLMKYLQRSHDYFLNFRLPQIRCQLQEALADDSPCDVSFVILRFFDEYAGEVNKHMSYEEKTVFPYVQHLLEGRKEARYNIGIFRKRHDQIDSKLSELKNILIKYYPGAGNNLLTDVLFNILSCEKDLASHCKMEDYLLTPAILELEKTIPHTP